MTLRPDGFIWEKNFVWIGNYFDKAHVVLWFSRITPIDSIEPGEMMEAIKLRSTKAIHHRRNEY